MAIVDCQLAAAGRASALLMMVVCTMSTPVETCSANINCHFVSVRSALHFSTEVSETGSGIDCSASRKFNEMRANN